MFDNLPSITCLILPSRDQTTVPPLRDQNVRYYQNTSVLARIVARHIGQSFSSNPQTSHVQRCPQSKNTTLFRASRQITHSSASSTSDDGTRDDASSEIAPKIFGEEHSVSCFPGCSGNISSGGALGIIVLSGMFWKYFGGGDIAGFFVLFAFASSLDKDIDTCSSSNGGALGATAPFGSSCLRCCSSALPQSHQELSVEALLQRGPAAEPTPVFLPTSLL